MNRPVGILLFSTALAMLSMAAPGARQPAAPAPEGARAATEAAEQQPTEQADGQEPAEQQPEPEPFAADGIPPVPLPAEPIVYDTAQRQRIRVSVVADGLTYPWGFAFLPDGSILVTERLGTLRRIREGVLEPAPIAGVPEVSLRGQARRTDGRRRPSGLRAEPAGVPHLLQARRGRLDGGPGPRPLRRRGAVRGPRRVRRRGGDERRRVPGSLRTGRDALHVVGRRLRRAPAARPGPGEPRRQDTAPAGRRHAAGRQPVRRPRRRPARGLLARAPQPDGTGDSPGDGGSLGQRARADGRRRGQPDPARPQLRLAGGVLLARVLRPARVGAALAGGHGAARDRLDPLHSPRPDSSSTAATASPPGAATCSPAR